MLSGLAHIITRWSVEGDPIIWANPRDVILYARSSYYHNNVFYIPISNFINCFALKSRKIAGTFAITFLFLTIRHHVFRLWFHA